MVSVTGARAETAPSFPSGTNVGDPPGFDGSDAKGKESDSSQLGAIAANVGYGLAGILAYFSVKRLPAAARQTASAARSLSRHAEREAEVKKLIAWGEALEKAKPRAMARIEKAASTYEKSSEALGAHVAELAPFGSAEVAALEIDVHLDRLLTLPLLARRDTLRKELKELIQIWKTKRDAAPLEKWISENRAYDLIRTKNGQAWLSIYQKLRGEFASLASQAEHSAGEMEKWVTSPVAPSEGDFGRWLQKYDRLKTKEQTAAERFASTVNKSLPDLFEKERPEISLSSEGRVPGQFLFKDVGGLEKLNASGVLLAAGSSCDGMLARIADRRVRASLEANPVAQLKRLVLPLAPLSVGTGVGGYYSVEGIRHWFGPTPP